MADGYALVVADLRAMTSPFEKEHEEYAGIKAKVTPAVAATGDAGLDETLRAVMRVVALLHDAMSARIGEHADKLGTTADAYERAEIDVHGLFDDLMAQ